MKFSKRLNLLRLLTGTSRGASNKSLLMLYRASIRSVIASGVQAHILAAKCHTAKLKKVSNKDLRLCCGAMRSTPLSVLQADCNEMPLHIRSGVLANEVTDSAAQQAAISISHSDPILLGRRRPCSQAGAHYGESSLSEDSRC